MHKLYLESLNVGDIIRFKQDLVRVEEIFEDRIYITFIDDRIYTTFIDYVKALIPLHAYSDDEGRLYFKAFKTEEDQLLYG